jgi:hypothetical protein
MPRFVLTFAIVAVLLSHCGYTHAQGFYYRTVQKNPLTGRQEIVDLQRPRWTGEGKGGFMFDPAIGAMQVAAVGRNRFTGRLEYYNRYLNPWTGAQQATTTQFNPFTQRYETLHQLEPPPARSNASEAADPLVVAAPTEKAKRRVRVIETNLDVDAPPPTVSPGATAPDMSPGGVLPPQEQASSKTIEWNKDHPESMLNIRGQPENGL